MFVFQSDSRLNIALSSVFQYTYILGIALDDALFLSFFLSLFPLSARAGTAPSWAAPPPCPEGWRASPRSPRGRRSLEEKGIRSGQQIMTCFMSLRSRCCVIPTKTFFTFHLLPNKILDSVVLHSAKWPLPKIPSSSDYGPLSSGLYRRLLCKNPHQMKQRRGKTCETRVYLGPRPGQYHHPWFEGLSKQRESWKKERKRSDFNTIVGLYRGMAWHSHE